MQDLGRWLTADPLFAESVEHVLKSPFEANLYVYVGNNPIFYIDVEGFAKLLYRSLDKPDFPRVQKGLDKLHNRYKENQDKAPFGNKNWIPSHQHIWFDKKVKIKIKGEIVETDNIGFTTTGLFIEKGKRKKDYYQREDGKTYDDDLLAEAVNYAGDPGEGVYEFLDDNCQHWIGRIIENYRVLQKFHETEGKKYDILKKKLDNIENIKGDFEGYKKKMEQSKSNEEIHIVKTCSGGTCKEISRSTTIKK